MGVSRRAIRVPSRSRVKSRKVLSANRAKPDREAEVDRDTETVDNKTSLPSLLLKFQNSVVSSSMYDMLSV